MNKKHVWTTLLALVATVVAVSALCSMNVFAAGSVASGTCGDNLIWELDSDGVLTISGNGDMSDFSGSTPWNSYSNTINTVIIESGVTSIGANAFAGSANISTVYIPDSVTHIGTAAFVYCTSLETIDIPSSVTKIDQAVFSASGIKNISLPANLEVVSTNLFAGCRSLVSVYIPDGVTNFESSVFSGSSIQSVRLPDDLTAIPDSMFANTDIVSVDFPASVTSIGRSAFYNCNFVSLVIPDGVTYIGENAFSDCGQMTSLVLPDTLTYIDKYAFSDCRNLETVTIPGRVEEIGDYAFYQCYGLKSVTILEGNQRTNIGDYAFQNCNSLKSITIPSNVEYIGSNAFEGCTRCEAVYCYANPANLFWYDVGSDDFKPGKATICYVPTYPADYLSDYKTKFASGKTGDINVTFVGDHDDMGIGDLLCGYSLSLEGDIGVNFYIHFDDVDALSDGTKMVFTISALDNSESRTQEVYLRPQSDPNKPYAKQDNGYYVFKCVVKAKEMTSRITAQIVDGNTTGTAYTYTVQDYAKYILLHPDKYKKEIPLIKAMLNYGTAAQEYFGYNSSKKANSILTNAEQYVALVDPDSILMSPTSNDVSIAGTNIRISMVSLSLKSTISMKFYISGADENTVFKSGDTVLTAVKSGEYYVVTIENIKAQSFNLAYSVDVYNGSDLLGSVNYRPVYYCKTVLASEITSSSDYDLHEVVSSIILYNQAAKEYVK